jgi:ribosomal protein S18 acetylase RimI-like enzyme
MLAPQDNMLAIRPATPADVDRVLELQLAGFGDDPHCRDRDGLLAAMTDSRIDFLVAEIDGAVAGFFLLTSRPFRPWTALDYIAVAPDRRSEGIGATLLDHAVSVARRRRLRLFVRESNTRAIRFYERHGFARAGIRAQNYHDDEDAVIMAHRRPRALPPEH